ncbi:MAG: MFS transporter permease [Desulfobacteraceae bacterium 4572_89]|nr:MAG: MFS transporter permease [Desulfobacteraceae bacterium 4572_89]
MTSTKKQILVPKEKAVFWLDKHGIWHNEHGKFEHPKIIRFFNTSIQKDDQGYHVYQVTDEIEEKVYFPYEDTALFVHDIIVEKQIKLILNTRAVMDLTPDQLFIKKDNLYCQTPEHLIKFTQHALVKLSRYIEEIDGRFCLKFNHTTHPIEEK